MYGSWGGFDAGGSARSNVERYNTYRSSGGDGGPPSSGNGGCLRIVFFIVLGLYFLHLICKG